MSNPDSILRQPVVGPHVRRLSGRMVTVSHQPAIEITESEPLSTLALLREKFAAELNDLREEARQYGIATARQEADVALRTAQEDQARQLQQKEELLRQDIQHEREQLMDLVMAVRTHHEQMIPEMEPVVARLALMVVTKLLGQHQSARPLVADLATHAIETYRLNTLVRINVAAEDYACIQAHEPAGELLPCLQIDHELIPGSCLIDYGSGQLDASLMTQWEAIQAMLTQSESGAGRVVSA